MAVAGASGRRRPRSRWRARSSRASRRSSSTASPSEMIRGARRASRRSSACPAAWRRISHSLCISIDDEVVHGIPGHAPHPRRARSCPSTPARSSTAGTATPPAPSSSATCRRRRARWSRPRARRCTRASPPPAPGNHLGDISAAIEDVAAGARLRHRALLRRPRHRHRDARGAAGHQLPHRLARPAHRGRAVPGHRADVHAGQPRGARPRRRLDRRHRRRQRSPRTGSTRIAVTADGPRILTVNSRRADVERPLVQLASAREPRTWPLPGRRVLAATVDLWYTLRSCAGPCPAPRRAQWPAHAGSATAHSSTTHQSIKGASRRLWPRRTRSK